MIDTTKTIREVRYNGTAIPLLGGVDNPVVVTSDAEMEACLNDDRYLGMYVKFSGESENYLNGQVYKIAQEGEMSKFYQLPMLDNEGTAADLAIGKQLIGSDGRIIIGAAEGGIATEDKFNQYLNKTITEVTEEDLAGVTSIDDNVFYEHSNLRSVAIPNGVTKIGYSTFQGCSGLINIIVPDSIVDIDCHAFDGCRSLTNIRIPEGITIIADWAFNNCSSLTEIVIPSSVTSLAWGAFNECSGLTNITLLPTTPPTLATSVFNGIPSNAVFTVPRGSLSAYQTADNWSQYADKIVEASN